MKAKVIIIFTFFLLGSTIISCFHDECDPNPPNYFKIEGLIYTNQRFTNSGLNPRQILVEGESVFWSYFFARFGFEMSLIADSRKNFGASVLAGPCDLPGDLGDKIGIDTLIVRTVYDYNEDYLAGSVINEIIMINIYTFRTSDFDDFAPIETYISDNSQGVREQTFELKLNEAPATDRDFAFDVTYRLNNGEEFQLKTQTVFLEK